MASSDVRAGATAVAPLLLGVVPFGLVAGSSPVAEGLGGGAAIGFSTIVFAGASQLAAIDVLAGGGSWVVAVLTACTINLRMVLYSASLAPFVPTEPLPRRMAMAYVLTDQVYALSLARWSTGMDPPRRVPYYLGAGVTLWAAWQAATVVGVVAGAALPDAVPLDVAVPLAFLVLLVPVVSSTPAVAAALVGGGGAVATAQLGGARAAVVVGSVAGIAAGSAADWWRERAAAGSPGPVGP